MPLYGILPLVLGIEYGTVPQYLGIAGHQIVDRHLLAIERHGQVYLYLIAIVQAFDKDSRHAFPADDIAAVGHGHVGTPGPRARDFHFARFAGHQFLARFGQKGNLVIERERVARHLGDLPRHFIGIKYQFVVCGVDIHARNFIGLSSRCDGSREIDRGVAQVRDLVGRDAKVSANRRGRCAENLTLGHGGMVRPPHDAGLAVVGFARHGEETAVDTGKIEAFALDAVTLGHIGHGLCSGQMVFGAHRAYIDIGIGKVDRQIKYRQGGIGACEQQRGLGRSGPYLGMKRGVYPIFGIPHFPGNRSKRITGHKGQKQKQAFTYLHGTTNHGIDNRFEKDMLPAKHRQHTR